MWLAFVGVIGGPDLGGQVLSARRALAELNRIRWVLSFDTGGHKRTRRPMTRGWKRLSDRQRDKLFCALADGDPTGEVGAALLSKERLREVTRFTQQSMTHFDV